MDGTFVGVDVGGREDKGYALCALSWRTGAVASVRFACVPHAVPLPPTSAMRGLVADGDLDGLAALTFAPAHALAEALRREIDRLAPDLRGVFVDGSSAFARNRAGHGRRTEKAFLREATFQSTPSVSCGRPHLGDWAWLVYGMVAFAAALGRPLARGAWRRHLALGLDRPARALAGCTVREVFPSATVAALRAAGLAPAACALIAPAAQLCPAEHHVVRRYLDEGVRGVKRRGLLFDRADALVAALSSLPYVDARFVERELVPRAGCRWAGDGPGAAAAEGVVVLPC